MKKRDKKSLEKEEAAASDSSSVATRDEDHSNYGFYIDQCEECKSKDLVIK
jgi:hypothetical protein